MLWSADLVFLALPQPIPRPHAVDLHVERETEQDPDQDDDSEHCHALERLIHDDGADDVRDDEHLKSEQDAAAEVRRSRSYDPALPEAAAASRKKGRNAPSPPMTMMPVPTV